MNAALALSVGIARNWVGLYTRGLPPEVREARRSEIDSDLWEQQWLASRGGDPAFGTAIEVLARMLFGVFSDITWRAEAGAPARADRRRQMNHASYMPGLLTVGVAVVAFFCIITAGIAGALIAIPIGIAMAVIALFRPRRNGATVGIGVDPMRTEGKSRWKWLLLVIGVCVATVVGMAAYAFSLEEWGAVRTMIFNLGGMLAIGAGLVALVLLISDLLGSVRRKTDG